MVCLWQIYRPLDSVEELTRGHRFTLTMLKRFCIVLLMNKLDNNARSQVIRCLVEGNSLRSTVRMTGVSMPTVLKLLMDIGEVCREYQDRTFKNLSCRRLQLDEVWQYCYAKENNVPDAK